MVVDKQVKEVEKSAVELTVTIGQNDVAQEYDKVVQKYAKKIQIKGFRKGKAPIAVLEGKYGPGFREEAMYNIIEASVDESLKEIEDDYKPLPYSTPKLIGEETLELDLKSDFSFSFSYDVFPKIDLPAYEGLSVEIPEVEIDESDIDAELAKLQDQNSMVTEKDKIVENDDIVTIDYAELDEEGNVIEGTAREDFVFTVGSGYNLYKIDEDVLGMKKDETKVIEKTFAEDFEPAEYAGKSIKLSVTVRLVKVKEIPELDDEFAQDISDEYETLQDLKDATKKRLTETLEARMRSQKASAIYDEILKDVSADLPESMIQAELENSYRNFAAQSGMSEEQLTQILAYQQKTKADLLEEWRDGAHKSILIQMLLEKVIKENEIDATDEDVAEEAKQLEGIENEDQKNYYLMMMKEDKKSQKALDLLLEKNSFTNSEKVAYAEFIKR